MNDYTEVGLKESTLLWGVTLHDEHGHVVKALEFIPKVYATPSDSLTINWTIEFVEEGEE